MSSLRLWITRNGGWFKWLAVATTWWTLDGFTDVMNYRVMTPAPFERRRRIQPRQDTAKVVDG